MSPLEDTQILIDKNSAQVQENVFFLELMVLY